MFNLKNSLIRESQKESASLTELSAITEAQRLLAEDGANDLAILREMGMHSAVNLALDKEGARIEKAKLDKKYGDIYTIDTIKKISCRYALKFLRSDNYKGAIDPVMIQKVKGFLKSENLEENKAILGFKFYVLAPQKDFRLSVNPRKTDPILFYKLDEIHYKLIHKWGTDLTIRNFLSGMKFKNKKSHWWYYFSKVWLICIPFIIAAFKFFGFLDNPIPYILLVTSLALSIIIAVNKTDIYDRHRYTEWKEVWNSNVELK